MGEMSRDEIPSLPSAGARSTPALQSFRHGVPEFFSPSSSSTGSRSPESLKTVLGLPDFEKLISALIELTLMLDSERSREDLIDSVKAENARRLQIAPCRNGNMILH